jgi:hypothetical protein
MAHKRVRGSKEKAHDIGTVDPQKAKRTGKKKGHTEGKFEVIQKSLSGGNTVVHTCGSHKEAQQKVEELVAQSNGSLKLHDFEINRAGSEKEEDENE